MSAPNLKKILITWAVGPWREPVERSVSGPEFGGINVVFCTERAEILRELADADVLCAGEVDDEMAEAAPQLKWIQLMRGGLAKALPQKLIDSPVVVTCLKELFAAPGAEFALMALLMISRRMTTTVGQEPLPQTTAPQDLALKPVDLAGATVGIVGLGNIGKRTAELCRAFGMRVFGSARTAKEDGLLDAFFPLSDLATMVAQVDYVVLAAPVTKNTTGFFDEKIFDAMKPEAWLVDVSARPQLLNYPALEKAIAEGKIAGVVLQPVGLQYEGMPAPESDFWKRPNVVVSSCRCVSVEQMGQTVGLFPDNFRRFSAGKSLRGIVNKAEGY